MYLSIDTVLSVGAYGCKYKVLFTEDSIFCNLQKLFKAVRVTVCSFWRKVPNNKFVGFCFIYCMNFLLIATPFSLLKPCLLDFLHPQSCKISSTRPIICWWCNSVLQSNPSSDYLWKHLVNSYMICILFVWFDIFWKLVGIIWYHPLHELIGIRMHFISFWVDWEITILLLINIWLFSGFYIIDLWKQNVSTKIDW